MPQRETLWEVLDRSLWGRPLGAFVLPMVEFGVLAIVTLPFIAFIRNVLVGLDYLPDGAWYPTMVAVLLGGMLVLSFMHTGASLKNPGRKLLDRLCSFPPTPGAHAPASSALRDVQIAAGLSEFPRLRLYASPLPNGCSFVDWDGHVFVAVSTGLAEGLGRDELRGVTAHLVARAQAPASRWLVLFATAVEPFRSIPIVRDEPNPTADRWALVVGALVFFACLLLGWAGVSLFSLVFGMVVPALILIGVSPKLLTWAATSARPGLDEWGDARGLLYTRDGAGMIRGLQMVLGAPNDAPGGSYDPLFFAPTAANMALVSSEQRRIDQLKLVIGAEAAGTPAAPIHVPAAIAAVLSTSRGGPE